MKALILAGGAGTRLRPLTYTMAKQLVPVANKPIINYVLSDIKNAGIKNVGVIISPETGDQIKRELSRTEWGLNINFILQDKPLGLAHTVLVAREFLGEEPFVMYLGDNLIQGGIRNIIDIFETESADSAIMLKEVDNPSMFGVAEINGQGDIISLVEKPKEPQSNLALVGIYVFSNAIHEAITAITPSDRGELEITDAIQNLMESGRKIKSLVLNNWWLDTGKKDNLLEANRVVLDELADRKIKIDIGSDTEVSGRVEIGERCEIINSKIRGPVVIGNNVRIINTFVGPYTSIGDYSYLNQTSVEHSVILEGVIVDKVERIEDSIIGKNAVVRKGELNHKAYRLMISDDSEVII